MGRRFQRQATNEDLEAELPRLAKDYHLLGGETLSMTEFVERHLWWFAAALARRNKDKGLTTMLFKAGIGRNGSPITRSSLSVAFRRNRLNRKNAAERLEQALAALSPPANERRRSNRPEAGEAGRPPGEGSPSALKKKTGSSRRPAGDADKSSQRSGSSHNQDGGVLEFMRRAARMRRGTDD